MSDSSCFEVPTVDELAVLPDRSGEPPVVGRYHKVGDPVRLTVLIVPSSYVSDFQRRGDLARRRGKELDFALRCQGQCGSVGKEATPTHGRRGERFVPFLDALGVIDVQRLLADDSHQ